MKFSNIFLIFSCFFIFLTETNGAHEAWTVLPRDTYSSNSKTLSIAVSHSMLRLVDSGRNFDIPIHTLLADHPALYKDFQTNISKLKSHLVDPKLREWKLIIDDTGKKYKISIQKTLGFPFTISLGKFHR